MRSSVAGYVIGNLLVSALAAVGSFVAMTILGVPYALAARAGGRPARHHPVDRRHARRRAVRHRGALGGWPAALILTVYFVVYQTLENHFLAPVIYSRTVAMSPLTVLLVSLAGAVLGGLVGVLLAIPLASAAQIAVGELLRAKGVEDLADLAEVITEEAPARVPSP